MEVVLRVPNLSRREAGGVYLRGLKENVIMGRLILAGTVLERYRNIQLLTEVPPPPRPEEVMPPAELSAEEAAALDFLRKDADALAEGGSD